MSIYGWFVEQPDGLAGLSAIAGTLSAFGMVIAKLRSFRGKINQLAKDKGISKGLLVAIQKKICEQSVEGQDMLQLLEKKADDYKRLKEKLSIFYDENPDVRSLKKRATKALYKGRFAEADSLLQQAMELVIASAHKQLRSAAELAAEIDKAAVLQPNTPSSHKAGEYYDAVASMNTSMYAPNTLQYLFWHAMELVLASAREEFRSAAELAAEMAMVAALQPNQPSYHKAAKCYAQAADMITPVDILAALQYREQRADILCRLGDEFGNKKALSESSAAYREVIAATDRAKYPEFWARLQNNLGNALRICGERESDTEHLKKAVVAYRTALKERARKCAPMAWAETQNNLGSAYRRLGERESGTKRFKKAVKACNDALEERTHDRDLLAWAETQINLGNALRVLGERESGTEYLEEAVKTLRTALEKCIRKRMPLTWATTQDNLGNALVRLGKRKSGTKYFEEAVAACRAALKERTRKRVPLDWANTQHYLGNALLALGERKSGTKNLKKAVTAFHAALEERTRSRAPLYWAGTKDNLGTALRILGERESGTERLEKAVEACNEALKERPYQRSPLAWAETQYNLGNALLSLGERVIGTERLEKAVVAYRAALEELFLPHEREKVQANLEKALSLLEQRHLQ
jgi:tetratricopeptide (TPR) repeat protein